MRNGLTTNYTTKRKNLLFQKPKKPLQDIFKINSSHIFDNSIQINREFAFIVYEYIFYLIYMYNMYKRINV